MPYGTGTIPTVAYFSMEICLERRSPPTAAASAFSPATRLRAAADLGAADGRGDAAPPEGLLPPAPRRRRQPDRGAVDVEPRSAAASRCRRAVTVDVEGRTVQVRAWRYDVRGVARSHRAASTCSTPTCRRTRECDRPLTDSLYGGDDALPPLPGGRARHGRRGDARARSAIDGAATTSTRGTRRCSDLQLLERQLATGASTATSARPTSRRCGTGASSRRTRRCRPGTTSSRYELVRDACSATHARSCSRRGGAATATAEHDAPRAAPQPLRQRRRACATRKSRGRCSRSTRSTRSPTACTRVTWTSDAVPRAVRPPHPASGGATTCTCATPSTIPLDEIRDAHAAAKRALLDEVAAAHGRRRSIPRSSPSASRAARRRTSART